VNLKDLDTLDCCLRNEGGNMNQGIAELVETPIALSVFLKAGVREEGCGRCCISISFRSEVV
jgi:hypothetical protein